MVKMSKRVINAFLAVVTFAIVSVADRGSQPRILPNYQKEHWASSGETLRLNCPVESDPAPIITWRKDGDDIHVGWERFRIRNEWLHVKDSEPADSGVYVCLATNGFGTVSVQFSVCILGNDTNGRTSIGANEFVCNFNGNGEMPSFLYLRETKDRHVQLFEGESTRLDCQATGRPRPDIRWFKNGREKQHSHNSAGNNWQLTLNRVTFVDNGRYTCSVYNRVGSINHTYIVKVSSRHVTPPEFRVVVLKNITAMVGSVAAFHCEAHSDVETRIQWMRQVSSSKEKHNQNYTIVMEDKHFTVIQQGQTQAQAEGRFLSKLTIDPVGINDSGVYVCSAANSYGFRLQSAFLKVIPGKGSGSDGEMMHLDYDGTSQFLPIIGTVVAILVVLMLGILSYFIFRRCIRSDRRCRQSPSTSNRCSPSSVTSLPVQRTNLECPYEGVKHHNHHHRHHQQLLSPGVWIRGQDGGGGGGGSVTSDAAAAARVSSARLPRFASSSYAAQREGLLHSYKLEHFKF